MSDAFYTQVKTRLARPIPCRRRRITKMWTVCFFASPESWETQLGGSKSLVPGLNIHEKTFWPVFKSLAY